MQKWFVLVFILAVCACSPKTTTTKTSSSNASGINTLFDAYWEERMQLFPLEATASGDYRYNDRMTLDITESFRDSLRRFYSGYLARLRQYDTTTLNENDRISYDIFRYEMQMQLDGLQYPDHFIPFNQFWGLPLTMGQLGSGDGNQPFKTVQDYRNWLKRATVFGVWADTAIADFRKGMAAGIVLPKTLLVKIIPQLADMASTDTLKNVFYG